MGKSQRSKGKRGERMARLLLQERDFTILSDTNDGSEVCDCIARSSQGEIYAIEVKNTRVIDHIKGRGQAKANAKKLGLPWMLMCRIENANGSWLVMSDGYIRIWTEK